MDKIRWSQRIRKQLLEPWRRSLGEPGALGARAGGPHRLPLGWANDLAGWAEVASTANGSWRRCRPWAAAWRAPAAWWRAATWTHSAAARSPSPSARPWTTWCPGARRGVAVRGRVPPRAGGPGMAPTGGGAAASAAEEGGALRPYGGHHGGHAFGALRGVARHHGRVRRGVQGFWEDYWMLQSWKG